MKKFRCTQTGCKFNKKGKCGKRKPDRRESGWGGFECYSFEPDNNERRGR